MNKPRPVQDSATLQDKDGLISEDQNSEIQLVCANGATLMLSGKFDAYLRLGSDQQGCTVYIRQGTAVATTAPSAGAGPTIPTVIQYGDVTLGAISTQFGATVTSSLGAHDVKADAFVVEGEVRVERTANAAAPVVLKGGQQLQAATAAVVPIPEERYSALATSYARLDAKQLPEAQRAEAQEQLRGAYLATLKAPHDLAAQGRLAQVYQVRQVQVSPVARYKTREFTVNAAATQHQESVQVATGNPAAELKPAKPAQQYQLNEATSVAK